MSRGKGHSIVSIIAGTAALAALIFAFIVPARYIRQMEQSMGENIRQAKDAVMEGDMELAADRIEKIYAEFQLRQDKLKLMCHHDDIDEMEYSINCSRNLAMLGQSDNLICELNRIQQVLEHMAGVENADIYEMF